MTRFKQLPISPPSNQSLLPSNLISTFNYTSICAFARFKLLWRIGMTTNKNQSLAIEKGGCGQGVPKWGNFSITCFKKHRYIAMNLEQFLATSDEIL